MIGRLVRLAILLAAIDVAAGVALDARMVARPWAECVAIAQRPTRSEATVCGRALESVWTTDLPAASWAILREARLIWRNSQKGVNTI